MIVKTAADIAAAIAEHPLRTHADNDSKLIVMFTQDAASLAALKPLANADWAPEAFAVGAHAAWLWCANGTIESRVAKAVGRLLEERGTARNWATRGEAAGDGGRRDACTVAGCGSRGSPQDDRSS